MLHMLSACKAKMQLDPPGRAWTGLLHENLLCWERLSLTLMFKPSDGQLRIVQHWSGFHDRPFYRLIKVRAAVAFNSSPHVKKSQVPFPIWGRIYCDRYQVRLSLHCKNLRWLPLTHLLSSFTSLAFISLLLSIFYITRRRMVHCQGGECLR